MYDYSKLLGLMKEKGMTQDKLSKRISVNDATLNLKLKNKSEFKQSEMLAISECLHIPLGKVSEYFFHKKLCKTKVRENNQPTQRTEEA